MCGSKHPLTFHASACEPRHEKLLAENKHEQYRQQTEYGQGKHISPLCELMLSEKTGNGNRDGPFQVIVDDGICPGEFLPCREKIKDRYRSDSRFCQRDNNFTEYGKYASPVHIGCLV